MGRTHISGIFILHCKAEVSNAFIPEASSETINKLKVESMKEREREKKKEVRKGKKKRENRIKTEKNHGHFIKS